MSAGFRWALACMGAVPLTMSSASHAESSRGGSAIPTRKAAESTDASTSVGFATTLVGVDVRVEGVGLFKRYTTVSRPSYAGDGGGAGIAVSASIHFRGATITRDDGGARWMDVEIGVGESAHYVFWRDGDGRSTAFATNLTAGIWGIQFATGQLREEGRWSGRVVEVAWVPTYAHIVGNEDVRAGGKLNPAGLRLSVDFGSMNLRSTLAGPLLRLSVTWLPYVGRDLPTMLTAGVGCAFY